MIIIFYNECNLHLKLLTFLMSSSLGFLFALSGRFTLPKHL